MKRTPLLVVAGCALLAVSGVLVSMHLSVLKSVRDTSLPLAAQILPLQERYQILTKQVDSAEKESRHRSGVLQEKLKAYVLPASVETKRALAAFEIVRNHLAHASMLRSLSCTEEGLPTDVVISPHIPPAEKQTIIVDAVVSKEGRKELLNLFAVSGLLTVADTLTAEQLEHLFTVSETENYAGILELEAFLRTDLLWYARNSRAAEDRVLTAYPSETFMRELHVLLESSPLREARELLASDVGEMLEKEHVWPLQFLEVESLTIEIQPDGFEHLHVTLSAYGRKDDERLKS